MARTLDDALLAVMRALPSRWVILRFERTGMRWVATIGKGETPLYRLVSDRGYIHVARLAADGPHELEPPAEQRLQVTPEQVAARILGDGA